MYGSHRKPSLIYQIISALKRRLGIRRRLDSKQCQMQGDKQAKHQSLLATLAAARQFFRVVAPADGTRAAKKGSGDFGMSPFRGQLSGKPLLATKL